MDKEQHVNRRVSIVIPVYNSSKTLPKCLDSMIAQTYQDLEIICVNDCSKDNSLEIIKEYQQKDYRVKLINHTENKNAGGARNSGIKSATGTYVCFVDNDDWMAPDAIEILVSESKNFSIDFVVSQWCQYYDDSNKTNMQNLIIGGTSDANKEYALIHGCRILGCLIKKQIFFDNGLFYPENMFWEDNAIAMSIIFSAKTINVIDKVLYYYQMVPNSSSRSIAMNRILDRIKTSDLAVSNMKRLGFVSKDNQQMVDFMFLCFSYHTIKMLETIGNSEAKNVLKLVSEKIRPLMPNKYINKYHSDFACTLSHPTINYYIYSLLIPVKKYIYCHFYKPLKGLLNL